MSTAKPEILHLRVAGSAKQPLKAIAAYYHRSQANAVEWLITQEYRRLLKAGELQEHVPGDAEIMRDMTL